MSNIKGEIFKITDNPLLMRVLKSIYNEEDVDYLGDENIKQEVLNKVYSLLVETSYNNGKGLSYPLTSSVRINNYCNFNCVHCYVDKKKQEISLDNFKIIVDNLNDLQKFIENKDNLKFKTNSNTKTAGYGEMKYPFIEYMSYRLKQYGKQSYAFLNILEESSQKYIGIDLSDKQKEAIKLVNSNNVCIITGGPGTGKTTIMLSKVLKLSKVYPHHKFLILTHTKQESNDLKVIIKSKELAVHTIKITSNCNKFPKKYRFTLCDRMQNKSMDIYELLLEANRTHISNLKSRNELQTKAITNCDKLLFYIEMCLQLNIIQPNSAEYWSKLVSDIKFMTIKWRTTDKERQSA